MKLQIIKCSGIFSSVIMIAILLMSTLSKVHAQGQSCDNLKSKKIESMYDKYNIQLNMKQKAAMKDTIKYESVEPKTDQLKKVKRTASSMFVSQRSNKATNATNTKQVCRIPLIKEIDFTIYAANFEPNR